MERGRGGVDATSFEGNDEFGVRQRVQSLSGDVLNARQYVLDQYSGAIDVDPYQYSYFKYSFGYGTEVIFPDFETAANFANITLNATLDLVLTGHPSTVAVVTANRNSLEGGNAHP